MNTERLIENIKRAVASNDDNWLESMLDDYRWLYYDNGVNHTLERLGRGIEVRDEDGETLGIGKYYFESGDADVGIADDECIVLTAKPIED